MGLFNQKQQTAFYLMPNNLFPCMAGSEIIKNKMSNYNIEIRNLTSVTDKLYRIIYTETMYRFAEICQAIPLSKNDQKYSLLQQCLKFCIQALKIRRKYLLPPRVDSEAIAQ